MHVSKNQSYYYSDQLTQQHVQTDRTGLDWTWLDHLHCWRSMTCKHSSHRGIVSEFLKSLLTAVQWDCCAKSAVDQLRFLRQAGCHVMLLPIHKTKTYSSLGSLGMAHVVGQWELFIGMWLSGTSHPRPYVIHSVGPGLLIRQAEARLFRS